MKTKVLIIESDLQKFDDILAHIINSKVNNIEIVGRANTEKEALALSKNKIPDVIFLSSETLNESILSFVKKIKTPHIKIILIFSESQNLLDSYKPYINAYLKNPLSFSEFKKILKKTSRLVLLQRKAYKKLIIKDKTKENHILNPQKITKLKSIGKDITEIHTNSETIITNKSIGKIQEKLDPNIFIRINWGIIVNSNYIIKVDFNNNTVYLKKDSEETISFRRKKDLKYFLNQ